MLKRLLIKLFAGWLGRMSTELFILNLIDQHLRRLPPREGLQMLFRLDEKLYSMQTKSAVNFGGGTHPKIRFLNYPNFFVQRVKPGETVLDIGCGFGVVAHLLAVETGALVTGVDLHAPNIERARREYSHPNVNYVFGDVVKDLPDQRFDTIILSNVLEHLPGRSTFLRGVQEITKPKRILIRVPLFERDWRVPLKKELGVEWRLDPTHETEYTLESFAEEMREANLHIDHLEVRWGEIWSEVSPNL